MGSKGSDLVGLALVEGGAADSDGHLGGIPTLNAVAGSDDGVLVENGSAAEGAAGGRELDLVGDSLDVGILSTNNLRAALANGEGSSSLGGKSRDEDRLDHDGQRVGKLEKGRRGEVLFGLFGQVDTKTESSQVGEMPPFILFFLVLWPNVHLFAGGWSYRGAGYTPGHPARGKLSAFLNGYVVWYQDGWESWWLLWGPSQSGLAC